MPYPSFLSEETKVQMALQATANAIAMALAGKPAFRITDPSLIDMAATHSIIVTTHRNQCDWFDEVFGRYPDNEACVLVGQLLSRFVLNTPLAAARVTANSDSARVDEEALYDVSVRSVTCYLDGERRRFIAHVTAQTIRI